MVESPEQRSSLESAGKELPVSIPGGDVRQDCETKRLEKEEIRISQDFKLKIIIEVAVIGP